MLKNVLKCFVGVKNNMPDYYCFDDTIIVKNGTACVCDTSHDHIRFKLQFDGLENGLLDGNYKLKPYLNDCVIKNPDINLTEDIIEEKIENEFLINIPSDVFPFILAGMEKNKSRYMYNYGSCVEIINDHCWVCGSDLNALHLYSSHPNSLPDGNSIKYYFKLNLVQILSKCGDITIKRNIKDLSKLYFYFNGGVLIVNSTSNFSGSYPNWRSIIPFTDNLKFIGVINELKQIGKWCRSINKIEKPNSAKEDKDVVFIRPCEDKTEIFYSPDTTNFYTNSSDILSNLKDVFLNWKYLDNCFPYVSSWHRIIGSVTNLEFANVFLNDTYNKMVIVMPCKVNNWIIDEEKVFVKMPKNNKCG